MQQARKDAGLYVSDRIELWCDGDAETKAALIAHETYVAEQVLAVSFTFGPSPSEAFVAEGKVGNGAEVKLGLRKR